MRSPLAASDGTIILTRADVARLLPVRDCIDAVEDAFRRHARGESMAPSVLGTHVDGGGFHVKTAGMSGALSGAPAYAMKVNANFPDNPRRHGLPTIQGVIALFDAANGRLLALMDSTELTVIRTAAASAVAAKYLAPDDVSVTLIGCGAQAASQLLAVACVRSVRRVVAIDADSERAAGFARDMSAELDIDVSVAARIGDAAPTTNVWITCTTASHWLLGREHVARGSFVAAVGADNPHKQELEPELLAENVVIADILDQCAAMGDLHHAIDAGLMRCENVRAELADVVSGTIAGRESPEEIVIFDSTGTALQDVAAATLVYQRALASGSGLCVSLRA